MRSRAEHEAGFVLHTYPYKETSLIVEVFTRHFGRVGLLARGARRPRSAMRGTLLAFHPLQLSWRASTELGTLNAIEWSGGMRCLEGMALMCGFYVNELLLRLLPRDDPHEELFDAYGESIGQLASRETPAVVLRTFERRLLMELGYAPVLEREADSDASIDAGARYMYEADSGPVRLRAEDSAHSGAVIVRGQTLIDLSRDSYASAETMEEARQLMRTLIAHRLGGQSLHTRTMLLELQEF